jgi:ABC-2 type transport system ATP-binding protein
MGDPLFKLRNVTKVYGTSLVLANLTLDIHPGEVFGLMGASGSGKTTLLHTLIGFLKPEKGDVLFRRHTKKGILYESVFKNPFAFKKMYGFTSQMPSFYLKLTVTENLHYFGTLYGLSEKAIEKNTKILLDLMQLTHARHVLAENLSGGMERRLDIACAMIHNPDVLILDEPTADLDPQLREHINDIIRIINGKGTTIVLSSHHLADMGNLCSRLALLNDGSIVETGTPDEIRFRHKKAERILLESYPGNYKKIIGRLEGNYVDCQIRGTNIAIMTATVQKTLQTLLTILEQENERILELSVVAPTLEDVFRSFSPRHGRKPQQLPPSTSGMAVAVTSQTTASQNTIPDDKTPDNTPPDDNIEINVT